VCKSQFFRLFPLHFFYFSLLGDDRHEMPSREFLVWGFGLLHSVHARCAAGLQEVEEGVRWPQAKPWFPLRFLSLFFLHQFSSASPLFVPGDVAHLFVSNNDIYCHLLL
jgi:hypothetical protein